MKRVYECVAVMAADGGFAVELDGRPVKTPLRRPLVVPMRTLADAIAAEWDAQKARVDPHSMPLMRLAAMAIDVAGARRAEVVDQIADYGATDLVCYRAEAPPALVERHEAAWRPLVDWVMGSLGACLEVTRGVVPVAQPAQALDALRRAIERFDDWRLVALGSATTASGSLVVGLALAAGRIDAEEAWTASQIDETFQIERWGEDPEAAPRRAALRDQIADARRFLDLLEG